MVTARAPVSMVTFSPEARDPHLPGLHFPLPRLVLGAVTQIRGRALPLSLQLTQSEKKRNKKIQRVICNQEVDAEGHIQQFSRPNKEHQNNSDPN